MNYYVILKGEVAEGYDIDEVKENIASILDEDKETIEELFSGRTLVIKRDPDFRQCRSLRDVFLSIGAVCYIRDSEGHTRNDIDESVEEAPQSEDVNTSTSSNLLLQFHHWRKKCLHLITETSNWLKQTTQNSCEKTSELYSEASESIKSDLEIGGMKMLSKNKYFLSTLATSLMLVLIITVGLNHNRKDMPISEENFTKILDHIGFIEKAFTVEELRSMTEDPSDFLDYLLVDPIKKMGYEFDASIGEISDTFLNDSFTDGEFQKVKAYLEITVHERDKLYEFGFITDNIKTKLNDVSKKMDQAPQANL